MNYRRHLSFVALAISSAITACSSSRAQQSPPPKEPVSTTRVTSSALTVSETKPQAAPSAPAGEESEADRALSAKIRQHLAKKPELSNVAWDRVRIVTVDGNVTIAGELPTTADAIEVEHAIREVKGVKSVSNEVRLPGNMQ